VPGRATQYDHPVALEPGKVSAGKLVLLDVRPPARPFGAEEQQAALDKLARAAGPATAAIESAVADGFAAYRAELNALAGGQASARVMILARNAELAQLATELQASISRGRHGAYVEAHDEGQTEKGLRNLVGLCAVATDLLNKATEAAKEEGKAVAQSPTDQLMTRLGVGQAPASTPVGGAVGAPLSPNPAPEKP
jgi:hypothetical protein